MWDKVLNYAIETNSGIFGVLFIALLIVTIGFVRWVLKTNNEREQRYISTIDKLAEGIQQDVREIKTFIFSKK